MKISVIEGHLTQREKDHIKAIINKGWSSGQNKRGDKQYAIKDMGDGTYMSAIRTHAVWTIGKGREWRGSNARFKIIK